MSLISRKAANLQPSPVIPHRTNVQAYQQTLVLAGLFVVSYALDFKGEAGGSPIQYVMAVLNTGAFLLLAVQYRVTLPRSGFPAFLFWGWVAFLFVGTVSALVYTVPFGHYIRAIYPYILFLEGFLVAFWIARDARGAATLTTAMMIAALVSLFFTFWWGLYFTGVSLGNIRYQILSPLIPFLVVVAGYDLFFARQHRMRALGILGLTVGLIFLSATRGVLLVIGMVVIVIMAAWLWNVVRNMLSIPRPILRVLLGGSVTASVGLPLALITAPDTVQRWVERGFGPGYDATLWTRVAAVVDQWRQLTDSPVAWLFGRGFGHSYHFAQDFAPLILPHISPTTFAEPKWFPAEFMWITPLYYGGFLIGVVAVLGLLYGALRAFRILTVQMRFRTWKQPGTRPIWVGALGFFAFLALGFTANPFIIRLTALFFGLALGLAITAGRRLH